MLKIEQKELTQSELAKKLGVTDRSISNWENGKNMPDLSLFKPLCDILGITINELMSGENIDEQKYKQKLEENFINTIDYIDKKNIESNDKKSIFLLIIGIIGVCISQLIFSDYNSSDYLIVVFTILSIYSIKRLFMKYILVRRIVAIILVIICILSLFLN